MNKLLLIGTAAIISLSLITPAPAYADNHNASVTEAAKTQAQVTQEIRQMMLERASEMMGHISLAGVAMDLGMKESAASHLKSAKTLATEIEKETPTFKTSETITAGKVTYSYDNAIRDYYVPVIDDIIAVRDFDLNLSRKNDSKFNVTKSSVVHFKMDINIQTVGKALDQVSDLLTTNDFDGAQLALGNIFDNALVFETEETNPLWAAHDNLVLTYSFMENHNFKGARFTLEKAENQLKALKKTDQGEQYAGDITQIEKEILTMKDTLKRDDPKALQKAKMRVAGWLSKTDRWVNENTKAPKTHNDG